MYEISQFIQIVAAPLLWLAHLVTPALALAGHRAPANSDFTIAAFAVSAGLIGFVCSYWAAWAHARFSNFRMEVSHDKSVADAELLLRNAIIAGSRQSVVVLGADLKTPINYGSGSALLEAGLAGRAANMLAASLDSLLKEGTPFTLSVPTPSDAWVTVRALGVGDRTVVFLEQYASADATIDCRAMLDSLPVPMWVRGQDLGLRWANPAFLAAVGAESLERALVSNAALGRFERDLAIAARDGAEIVHAKRYVSVGGERRALNMNLSRMSDACIAGFAIDVTDQVKAEAKLQIEAEATIDMLDKVSIAIAVFGADRRLAIYNTAYARLWHLTEAWLDTKPTQGEILDRLRETRRLPEQRDFAAWKREYLELFEEGGHRSEDFWHLPDGLSLHMTAEPHLQGGLFFTFEDVSEAFQLKASLSMLGGVQRATLDTMEDGVAIFAPDGRLMLHNEVFAKLSHLAETELSGEPHFARLADYYAARVGRDSLWDIVSAAVLSADPERYNEWGKVVSADGKTISLNHSRLPNGATLVTFRDITDIERFEAVLGELTHRAA